MIKKIFITGGAGYVGTALTNKLLKQGYEITVYDLLIYGNHIDDHKNLKVIKGDLRDYEKIESSLKGHDCVIHLACISNDPSFELNPKLGKEINFETFEPLVLFSKKNGIKKFIYASSSSVYGIKSEKNVHEEMSLEPLTDYSKFKAQCEKILLDQTTNDFVTTVIRPATVCGYSPRQRLDLVVNILTNLAYHKRKITVFGGEQLRPNIHINDMIRSYELIINSENNLINGQIFNVGFENQSVYDLAKAVKEEIGDDVEIAKSHSDDNRSYHISSKKIFDALKFKAEFTINDAVKDLKYAFDKKLILNSFEDENYFNIKKMNKINLI
jgi:nucleoside-diphosphate-sugar epimerase